MMPIAEMPAAVCSFMSAAFVSPPNIVVSLPEEPGPLIETV